ncbi:hypothetical protein, partial [Bacillus coahuilensis]|uniref:hypothetical protein n=1 Tax=Bacillus coahuilensis TaxID=408580 RepID=UPI0019D34FA6
GGSAVHKGEQKREKSTARGGARCTKRRKEGRRAPRRPSAVQKEEKRREKSIAQTERGAQRGEKKGEERHADRARCTKRGAKKKEEHLAAQTQFPKKNQEEKQYRAISPQPDNRRHPVNTQKPRQINSKKTNNPKRSSVYTPKLLKQRIKATASLSHKSHLPYK